MHRSARVHLLVLCSSLAVLLAAAGSLQGQERSVPVVRVFAAGSLTAPLTAVAEVLKRERNIDIQFTFGPSGTLRERIEAGESADLFASANMDHPETLHAAGKGSPVQVFTRNSLCLFSRPDVNLRADNILDRMLDPAIKLGTSTPVSDPAGDYTWSMFQKAEALKAGAYETLSAKALRLFGGSNTAPAPPAPQGRNATAYQLSIRTVDVYIQYCSGRDAFLKDSRTFVVMPLPESLAVAADYGLTLLGNATADASKVAAFILSPAGQRIFAESGFAPLTTAARR